METTLAATKRTEKGKGDARKLRASGRLLAVLYGVQEQSISLTVDPKELTDIFRDSGNRNTVVQLEIDGTKVPTIVREAQRHPVSRELLHVDFQEVSDAKPVQAMVPVTTTGKPAGAIFGGRLRLIRRELRVQCAYDKIPTNFEVDVSNMNVGDMVRASEISVPKGVKLIFAHDFNVLCLYGKKSSEFDLDLGAEPAIDEEQEQEQEQEQE
jgi:large subunit ribosomal protein L25